MSLHIRSVQLFFVEVPLRFSVEHALAARRTNTTGLLVLTSDDGTQGIGEFLERAYVMGETRDEIAAYLNTISPLLVGAPVDDPIALIRNLWEQSDAVPGKSGGIGALDLALLDLWGKVCGKPVAALLTANPLDPARKISFSAIYPFARGLKLTALNFSYARLLKIADVKVKGSGELERDLSYVETIRHAFSYPVTIRLDLNGSLAPANAGAYLARLLQAGVTWFEQPFPKNDWASSARFQNEFRGSAIFCADESVCTFADLERAIEERAFDAINIRIGKNGGLLQSLKIYERAIKAGLQVQLGALVGETSVLAYAGLHFAAATAPLVHYEGAFGKYLVNWDILKKPLTFARFGHVALAALPNAGLVPAFDLERIKRSAVSARQLA